MKFFLNYTWIIIFIILFYGVIKDFRTRQFINQQVKNATIFLLFISFVIVLLLTGNFLHIFSAIDLLGIIVVLWFIGITYIIYQHYLEAKTEEKKSEYISDLKGFIIITIVMLLYVISNLLS